MQSLPDWLKIGAWVDVRIFVGRVADIAISEKGAVLVFVQSAKEAVRRCDSSAGEWLVYHPDSMLKATPSRVKQDIVDNRTQLASKAAALEVFNNSRWPNDRQKQESNS